MAIGSRLDPFFAFNFLVEIDGLLVAGFSEVTGLQVETVVETYREGGLNEFEHKLPGPARYPQNLILKRGLTTSQEFWRWHRNVLQGNITRRNVTIYLMDSQQMLVAWWDLIGAYPVKWSGPDLRADASSVAVETVELVHQGFWMTSA